MPADWTALSAELLHEVCCSHLHPDSVAAARLTCRAWRDAISQGVECVSLSLGASNPGAKAHTQCALPHGAAAAFQTLWHAGASTPCTGSFFTAAASGDSSGSSGLVGPNYKHDSSGASSDSGHQTRGSEPATEDGHQHQHKRPRTQSRGSIDPAARECNTSASPLYSGQAGSNCRGARQQNSPDLQRTARAWGSVPQKHPALRGRHDLSWLLATRGLLQMGVNAHGTPVQAPQGRASGNPATLQNIAQRVRTAYPSASRLLLSLWPSAPPTAAAAAGHGAGGRLPCGAAQPRSGRVKPGGPGMQQAGMPGLDNLHQHAAPQAPPSSVLSTRHQQQPLRAVSAGTVLADHLVQPSSTSGQHHAATRTDSGPAAGTSDGSGAGQQQAQGGCTSGASDVWAGDVSAALLVLCTTQLLSLTIIGDVPQHLLLDAGISNRQHSSAQHASGAGSLTPHGTNAAHAPGQATTHAQTAQAAAAAWAAKHLSSTENGGQEEQRGEMSAGKEGGSSHVAIMRAMLRGVEEVSALQLSAVAAPAAAAGAAGAQGQLGGPGSPTVYNQTPAGGHVRQRQRQGDAAHCAEPIPVQHTPPVGNSAGSSAHDGSASGGGRQGSRQDGSRGTGGTDGTGGKQGSREGSDGDAGNARHIHSCGRRQGSEDGSNGPRGCGGGSDGSAAGGQCHDDLIPAGPRELPEEGTPPHTAHEHMPRHGDHGEGQRQTMQHHHQLHSGAAASRGASSGNQQVPTMGARDSGQGSAGDAGSGGCASAGGARSLASPSTRQRMVVISAAPQQAGSDAAARAGGAGSAPEHAIRGGASPAQAAAPASMPTCYPTLLPGLLNLRELRLLDVKGVPPVGVLLSLSSALRHLRVLDVRAIQPAGVGTMGGSEWSCQPQQQYTPGGSSSNSGGGTAAISDAHLEALSNLAPTLTGLHLNMVHGVSGPGLLSSVGRLSGLVSLSLTDALDARRVAAKHLRALALSLPHLLALDIGRLTLGPAEMVLMQQAGGGGVLPQNLLPADAYALLAPAGAPVPGSQGSEWGPVLSSFSRLQTLGLQAINSFEPQLLTSCTSLTDLSHLELTGVDLPYSDLMVLLECARPWDQLRSLSLRCCVMYDAHLSSLAHLHQLQCIRLSQVDVRTRDACGWTSLSSLTGLQAFEFQAWNNPALSVGNLAVLTDQSVQVMAKSWQQLEQLRYTGKVVLTSKAREALTGLPNLLHLHILGSDGTVCIGSRHQQDTQPRSGGTGQALHAGLNGTITQADVGHNGGTAAGTAIHHQRGGGQGRVYMTTEADGAAAGSGGASAGGAPSDELGVDCEGGGAERQGTYLPGATVDDGPLFTASTDFMGGRQGPAVAGVKQAAVRAQQDTQGYSTESNLGQASQLFATSAGDDGDEVAVDAMQLEGSGQNLADAAGQPLCSSASAASLADTDDEGMQQQILPLQHQHQQYSTLKQVQSTLMQREVFNCGVQPHDRTMVDVPKGRASLPPQHADQERSMQAGPAAVAVSGPQQALAAAGSKRPVSTEAPDLQHKAARVDAGGQDYSPPVPAVHANGHTPAGGTGMGGGLQVQLLLPHARKLSSCNGYITHSGTPSLNGSQGSEESVNWVGHASGLDIEDGAAS